MRLSAKKTTLFVLYLCMVVFAGLKLRIYTSSALWNSENKLSPRVHRDGHHVHVETVNHNVRLSDKGAVSTVGGETVTETVYHVRTLNSTVKAAGKFVPFIPDWKDVEKFRQQVEILNEKGFVHNEDRFGLSLTPQSVVILVQVHDRADQLKMQIDSFREMRHINETLVIFSHDYFSDDVFQVIRQIDFCPYMQIFYPYPIQVYSKQFPGTDPNDCARNLDKTVARHIKCNNAEFQDPFGHYREAPHAQLKHHWLWKLRFIFDECLLLRNYKGIIFRLDDDYYLAEDTLDYLKKLDSESRRKCPECKMYVMGESTDYFRDNYRLGDAKKDYWWAGNGRGMAFRKDFWEMLKNCSKSFCFFDDCNWDWSLMHVTATCIPGGLKILKPLGSRVFHLGSCKGFHQNKSCKTTDVLQRVKTKLEQNKKFLFPNHVNIAHDFPVRFKLDQPYGGWTDVRDREMCMRIFYSETLTTTDLQHIHQKLLS